MLALAAAIVFAIGFLLNLVEVTLSARINLLYLGLTLLALHFVTGATKLLSRRRR